MSADKINTMNTLKNIVQLLVGNADSLQAVFAHSQRLETLNHAVRGCLPAPLNQHCQVANLRDNTLVLHADSSAWALKLRYSSRTLLQQLHQHGLQGLNALEVKVRPDNIIDSSLRSPRPEKVRHAHMSRGTAQLLDSIAADITDAPLKVALQRLARHGKKAKQQ